MYTCTPQALCLYLCALFFSRQVHRLWRGLPSLRVLQSHRRILQPQRSSGAIAIHRKKCETKRYFFFNVCFPFMGLLWDFYGKSWDVKQQSYRIPMGKIWWFNVRCENMGTRAGGWTGKHFLGFWWTVHYNNLVGGLEHFCFHILGYIENFIIPTDELIFFRGVGQLPTSINFVDTYWYPLIYQYLSVSINIIHYNSLQ